MRDEIGRVCSNNAGEHNEINATVNRLEDQLRELQLKEALGEKPAATGQRRLRHV
jgi:hypothetical protein